MNLINIFLSSVVSTIETVGVTLLSTGQLNDTIVRSNFAIDSITPAPEQDGSFSAQTFSISSDEPVNNLTNFMQANFSDASGSFLDQVNLASVFISSELSGVFQQQNDTEPAPRPFLLTFYGVDSPLFQDSTSNLSALEVGSIVFSVVVDTGKDNITVFQNLPSPIQFQFQVTQVGMCVYVCCVSACVCMQYSTPLIIVRKGEMEVKKHVL